MTRIASEYGGTFQYVWEEAILDEFERCGVSAAEFAAQYQTFAHWQQFQRH